MSCGLVEHLCVSVSVRCRRMNMRHVVGLMVRLVVRLVVVLVVAGHGLVVAGHVVRVLLLVVLLVVLRRIDMLVVLRRIDMLVVLRRIDIVVVEHAPAFALAFSSLSIHIFTQLLVSEE